MPRPRKPRPDPKPQAEPQAAAVNGPPGEVLTLAEAVAYLLLAEADVISAVHAQGLPGRLINGEWRFLKTAIQQWLSVSQPPAEVRNAAMLAMVGAWKDDPNLEQIVEDAMRRRGRPLMEDGTYSGLNDAKRQRTKEK
jgi:hypothetical protein